MAEAWLAERFERTRRPTKYIAAFKIGGGQEIALERARRGIQVWLGSLPEGAKGVRVLNRSHPGQAYAPSQSRNSNLRSMAPTLASGRLAYCLAVDDLGALKSLVGSLR
jgi:hypothetical protein